MRRDSLDTADDLCVCSTCCGRGNVLYMEHTGTTDYWPDLLLPCMS
jgi:hypothetical protein